VMSHCGFDLHFSDNQWCWAFFFIYLLVICIPSFDKCLFRPVAHFNWVIWFLLLLSFWNSLYILGINP
jgi:hypothetical protein